MARNQFSYEKLLTESTDLVKIPADSIYVDLSLVDYRDDYVHKVAPAALRQPIIVQKKGDKHRLICGQNRHTEKLANAATEFDAVVLPEDYDEYLLRIHHLADSIQYEGLNPIEIGRGLVVTFKRGEPFEDIAKKLNRQVAWIEQWYKVATKRDKFQKTLGHGNFNLQQLKILTQLLDDASRREFVAMVNFINEKRSTRPLTKRTQQSLHSALAYLYHKGLDQDSLAVDVLLYATNQLSFEQLIGRMDDAASKLPQ